MLKRVMYLAVLAIGFGSPAARADFVIDTFTTPSSAVNFSLAGPAGSTYTNTTTLEGGLTRLITVTQTANTFGSAGATSGLFGQTSVGGRFVQSTNAGATAFTSLLYTYATPQDLSASDTAVRFTFASADLNTPFSVRISDGTTTGTQVGVVTASTLGMFSLPINNFGVDLNSIRSIELLLNRDANNGTSVAEADLTLSDVRITAPNAAPTPPSVPAPPALALFAAAVPALGLVRRARRKADA